MKIGFASNLYGTPKGHSYVVNDMVKILKEAKHEVHMFRIGNNPILSEFAQPDSVKDFLGNVIPEKDFREWLDEVKPEWCVFMEYAQWWDEDHDKLAICEEKGIKTAGFLVYERLDFRKYDHYKLYTKIICPTGFQTRYMRKNGLYNAVHVPWGIDLKETDAVPKPPQNSKVRFYHCAGSGGVDKRKNTEAVVEAYKKIQDETTDLIITHLGNKIFSKAEIYAFMKYSDVLVNTAKWDTIGLNTLEANACGIPAILCDTEPMNEIVKDHVNGLLVKGEVGKSQYVTCPTYSVDIEELAKAMAICKNKIILETLKNNARKFAETNFDWEKNKIHLIKVFE